MISPAALTAAQAAIVGAALRAASTPLPALRGRGRRAKRGRVRVGAACTTLTRVAARPDLSREGRERCTCLTPAHLKDPSMRIFTATIATETNTFSPMPTSLDALQGERVLAPRRAPRRRAAHVHRAALGRPPPRRRGGLHPDRGQLLRRQPGGHHQPRRLRVHARRDPGPGEGGDAAGRRAARAARRHGGARLRRRRGRRDRAGARHRRPGLRHRGRTRSALPSHAEAGAAVRHHHPLQGVSAHRRGGARRGPADAGAADDPQADQAGDVAVRLPADRQLSDHAAADARLRRPD